MKYSGDADYDRRSLDVGCSFGQLMQQVYSSPPVRILYKMQLEAVFQTRQV